MADISKIKIPDGTSLNIKDATARQAIENLPKPMVFKGSLGTGGTITSLPTASSSNTGYVYKVIKAGTYASQSAKIGDTFVSDGSSWVLIPSGDEPSGTVTSIKISATSPINIDNSAAITTSGTRTISHASSGVSSGTYKSVTVNSTGHVTAGTNPTTIDGYGITDSAGRIVTGKEYTIDGETAIAGTGAEVFNEYSGATENIAVGDYSHAEGSGTTAIGMGSHAEGGLNVAEGTGTHAEGAYNTAKGDYSHVEGYRCQTNGDFSHAEGRGTVAYGDYQHVEGRYNVHGTGSNLAFIIGNGTDLSDTSNAFAIDWDGKIYTNNAETGVDVNKLAEKVVDEGAKNLLKIMKTSQTIKGVTFTVNSDGTVIANGTNNSTSSATFVLMPYQEADKIPNGSYRLTGCPSAGSSTKYDLRWYLYSPGKSAYDTGNGAVVEKNGTATGSGGIAIVVKAGQTVNNVVFKPMICTLEDYAISSEYVPYAESNYQLTKNKTSKEDVFGSGTLIPNNTDWDTLTDIGNYYVASAASMATMTNSPTNNVGGRLEVTTANAIAHKIQRFYAASTVNQRLYIRMLVLQSGGLAWTDWSVYYGTFASDDTWITLKSGSGTGISASDVKYRLNGKTMCITGYVKPSSTAASVTIGTLAEKYRPISLQTDHVSQASGIAETTFSAQVLTDGTVKFQGNSASAITANIQYYFTLTYIVAN